ncbi:FKBP-type peptidyl-prolyl cis-trans isomerase [Flavihumibacter profundi]|uniref:FKBP-type peptidyl-prolyl cis-trans isomerase n=1 Tax=Flavihumibacter profundi TaxID=2716883 RepID=UPI001CC713AB|nr:FKBP-type peptidyl-prolyl cis-trans isomerase [Flavihumibacter profundi]MBZ5856156.1 FKBP-type peptidyl-prolyl cis-trans isomerase [Flavihumibacter profundi]
MTKISLLTTAIAAIMMAACGSADYSKTKSGITYKIVEKGSGPQVKLGQFLKVHYTQKVNDSILGTSIGGSPAFARVDSIGAVYNPAEIFRFLHKGDSVVVVQEVDSLLKQNPVLPPFMKKGGKLYLTLRVVDVLDNEADVKAAQEVELKAQETRDVASLDEYLKKNNITAKKIGRGTYVSVQSQGEGAVADSGKFVSVRYRGKLMSTGKEFETNMEAGKEPITFPLGQGQVIPGWDEGLKEFAKGGKGTLYIPGFLAYGSRPGPGGKPNEALIFDVEMVDIADKAPAPKQNPMLPPVQGQPKQTK